MPLRQTEKLLRLPKKMKSQVDRGAPRLHMTASTFIRIAIQEKLDRHFTEAQLRALAAEEPSHTEA